MNPTIIRKKIKSNDRIRSIWINYKYFFDLFRPSHRKTKKRLKYFKDRYKGKRCFIMGNGPSLNSTPLNRLENEIVWGLNKCYLLFDRISWRPKFYTAVDSLVVPEIAEDINKLTIKLKTTAFFFPLDFNSNGIIKNRNNTIWFRQHAREYHKGYLGYFSSRADKYLRVPNTVSITALQLSVYMGFSEIYLIGCDTKYEIPGNVKMEGQCLDRGTGEFLKGFNLTSEKNNDPNHFSKYYFGKNCRWHHPNVNGMIYGYKLAKIACEKMGVKVYDATINGELKVFPKVELNSVL